ncbi:MAG TPA: hypothetical protein VE843_12660, partial [Ktedonobacteraceae bacterium]|nr:hypothetical protein [Ktedonobacteraceae bacterium]
IAQENNMRILAIDGVTPSAQTLLDGTYTFWSVEHAYTLSGGTAVVQAYEQFMKSEQEQNILLAYDVVPMNMIDQNVLNNHGCDPVL